MNGSLVVNGCLIAVTALILPTLVPAAAGQTAPTNVKTKASQMTSSHPKTTTMNANEEAVAAILIKYQDALNASDAEAAMKLYTADAVNMTPNSPPLVGIDALRKAYTAGFQAIQFHVKFQIVEVVEMAPGWAYARTSSAGTTTNRKTGARSVEANQELFILRKDAEGVWKIARYSFSSTNPLPA
jgi:uncharacterized protein (TIGR02246 family)